VYRYAKRRRAAASTPGSDGWCADSAAARRWAWAYIAAYTNANGSRRARGAAAVHLAVEERGDEQLPRERKDVWRHDRRGVGTSKGPAHVARRVANVGANAPPPLGREHNNILYIKMSQVFSHE